MQTVEAHVGKMGAELSRWRAKLEDLAAKADAAGTGAKIDYRGRLDDAREKYEIAAARLAELERAGNDRWETLQPAIETAWIDLEDAFRKLPGSSG